MAIAFNTAFAADFAGVYVTDFPAGALLNGYTGTPPAIGSAASGTLVFSIVLPSTPLVVTSNHVDKSGTWSVAAAAAGLLTYYRLVNAAVTKWEQGTITASGGGGDAIIDNTTVVLGQTVTCTALTRNF
jgi:hypothetical protein